jgi:hypothetical protein
LRFAVSDEPFACRVVAIDVPDAPPQQRPES